MTIAGSTGFGRSIRVSRLTVSRTALSCRLQATDSSLARGESGESGVGAGDGIRGPEYRADSGVLFVLGGAILLGLGVVAFTKWRTEIAARRL